MPNPVLRAFRGALAAMLIAAAAVGPAGPSVAQSENGKPIGREDFFVEGIAPVRKSAGYDLTIVYFMDYQCPACRKYTPDVARAFREDRRLRIIYRDTPIFGPRSQAAARAAIASQFQGRHDAMHMALMTSEGALDDDAIRAAADRAGVDWQRLQRDLAARGEEIDRLIAWNQRLSRAAGVSGTPAFVVGTTLADGALDYRGMKNEIADARGTSAPETPAAKPAPAAAAREPQSAEQAKAGAEPSGEDDAVAVDADPAEGAATTRPDRQPFPGEPTAAGTDGGAANSKDGGRIGPTWGLIAGLAVLAIVGALALRRKGHGRG